MNDVLSQWEAEAKHEFERWKEIHDCGDPCEEMWLEHKRILSLIRLVREKDQILKRLNDISRGLEAPIILEKAYGEVEKALALKEKLK